MRWFRPIAVGELADLRSYLDNQPDPIAGAAGPLTFRETFHIELLGLDDGTATTPVQQRVSVRVSDLDGATERALRLFARARAPQRSQARAEAVRVIDGAGREVFRWSRFDEPGG